MCLAKAPLFKFRTTNDPGSTQQDYAGGCLLRAIGLLFGWKISGAPLCFKSSETVR